MPILTSECPNRPTPARAGDRLVRLQIGDLALSGEVTHSENLSLAVPATSPPLGDWLEAWRKVYRPALQIVDFYELETAPPRD